jgi:hypothetical protein
MCDTAKIFLAFGKTIMLISFTQKLSRPARRKTAIQIIAQPQALAP